MSEQSLIHIQGLTKFYGKTRVLSGINMTLNAGEMMALLGHNGAGKTTLMKVILGLVTFDSGDVTVLSEAPGKQNQAIGYVPENVSFYPALSGYETLMFFARLNGLNKKQSRKIVGSLLEKVQLTEHMTRPVKHYSKGMKQRLGLAQALLPRNQHGESIAPKLLILDEPTVGLDPIATNDFFNILHQLQLDGCGVIICTHVLPGLESFIDKATILSKGQLLASGSLESLQQQADLPVTVVPTGLNGSLAQNETLHRYLQANGQLHIPLSQKIPVMQTLMSMPGLTDVQLHSPTLPELYQHLLQSTGETQHEH